jgi:hypothetical protein
MPDVATISLPPNSTPSFAALYATHVFGNGTLEHFSECEMKLLAAGRFSFSFSYFVQFGVLGEHLYLLIVTHKRNEHDSIIRKELGTHEQ